MKYRKAAHRRSPTPPRRRVQHETNVTRAYRLGKSETFWNFVCLLSEQHYSAPTLRRQIVGQLEYLATVIPSTSDGLSAAPDAAADAAPGDGRQQEALGQADACRACLPLIDAEELYGQELGSRIIKLLFAAWPPDYLEYRRRYMAFEEEDPTMPEKVDCLQLREWYDAVDALQIESDRNHRAELPPSHAETILQIQLLRTRCEPNPRAE